MKVFQVDDSTWMAGADAKSCVAEFLKSYGGEQECVDEFGPPTEVTAEEMATMIVTDVDEPGQPKRTFQKALNDMIAAGSEFPTFFASTEY
jgi:hypothetical protein